MSGKDSNRPKYQAMRIMLRDGDLLYLDALDRLGRVCASSILFHKIKIINGFKIT